MSFKSIIQIFIFILIILIVGGVYYKYFDTKKNTVEEINTLENIKEDQLRELEKKINDLELKNKQLSKKIEKNIIDQESEKSTKILEKNIINNPKITEGKLEMMEKEKVEEDYQISKEKKYVEKKIKIKNLVKDVEYISVDQKGNKFYLLANSGKSNINNNDILDLVNVRGKITSESRDTIFITSDFAQYNSINLNSKFYKNVVIDYQDKNIICDNFDINMETNKAVAYNNVIVTDPKSEMKAGIVEFDLKTKDININPKNSTEEIEVITN